MVKPSKGLRPGEVTKLTVFPYGFSTFLTREEVGELDLPVLNRRSNLDYEDFGVFKSDVTTIVLVEHVIDGEKVRYECKVGGKRSRRCVHVLALEISEGQRDRVDDPKQVLVANTVKKEGRPKKVGKQWRV